jgi:hypothetical protein
MHSIAVVRGMHVRVAEIRRIGRDQRQVVRVGERNQAVFRGVLDRSPRRASST